MEVNGRSGGGVQVDGGVGVDGGSEADSGRSGPGRRTVESCTPLYSRIEDCTQETFIHRTRSIEI